jgi:hypothetical protein
MRECEVFQHPVAKWAELVAGRLRDQPFDELRLPSLSLWRSYERTGPGVGGCSAVVAPDQMKAQVDPRRYAGRCQDVAVVNKQAVRQHLDLGVAALQLIGPSPSRACLPNMRAA